MNSYKLTIKVKSSLSTPLMADTIFGHICWGIVYNKGEEELESFLELYDNETPPLVLSDGFEKGKVPKPIMSTILPDPDIGLQDINIFKKAKKIKEIPYNFLKDNSINDAIIAKGLFLLEDEKGIKKVSVAKMHNTINRISGSTEDGGGLFSSSETWFNNSEERNIFDIYIFSIYEKPQVFELFNNAFENGYGADKSTGKGHIEIIELNNEELTKKGNRALALTSFVPDPKDEISNLKADIFIKYGKLGGNFANSENPFKKPIIMYKTGSTFDSNQSNDKPFIGKLLKGIHNNEKIRHYAISPLIYFNENEVLNNNG